MDKTKRKWSKQAEAAKATQVAFDVSESLYHFIQLKSVEDKLKPSDFIRKVLGLDFKSKKVRPRLTVTLSHDDYQKLGQEFNIDPDDRIAIKAAVTNKLIGLAKNS
ncbi:hypothetical protein [Aliikangiella sp. IMCC44359]|uniref:hypothetical protein n=1 Tax=Aliikangiella sp. IMCC44359 TaxID=3459125 RepID=UPI00403AD5AD